jgi:iron complex transport system substrate-binding protein
MPCGLNRRKVQEEIHWLVDRREWAHLRAVRDNRVYLTDSNQFFNRPGPRLVESLRIPAEVLHPGLFDPNLMGIGWSEFQT